MKTVIIMGAGASRRAGGPLMGDFLDIADDLLRSGQGNVSEAREDFERVFQTIEELRGVFAKSHLDLVNIEALFGAIEMARITQRLGSRTGDEIAICRDSLVTLIVRTLESTMRFPVSGKTIMPPEPYKGFVQRLRRQLDDGRWFDANHIGFLTFNYDLCLDFALRYNGVRIDYGLSDIQEGARVPLLKLHGSINWGRCGACKKIVPFHVDEAHFDLLGTETKAVIFDLGTKLGSRSCCGTPLSVPPVVVPPTWNKTQYHDKLAPVWQRAAVELASAENVVVIGYSLPETDSFFRYLIALGLDSPTRIRRFWVIDPDPSGEVEARYRQLIGKGIEKRFQFHQLPFEEAIELVMSAVQPA